MTARARIDSKRRFVNLAVAPGTSICDTSDQALAYFQHGGKPFTTAVMRKFAEAVAITIRPLLVDGVLSARSCACTLMHLWSAAKAAGNPVHRDFKQAALLYIYGPLVTRGLIHITAKEKVTAIPEDISAFVNMIFTPILPPVCNHAGVHPRVAPACALHLPSGRLLVSYQRAGDALAVC